MAATYDHIVNIWAERWGEDALASGMTMAFCVCSKYCGCFDFFSILRPSLILLSPSLLGEMKYCLKGPLNPWSPTNRRYHSFFYKSAINKKFFFFILFRYVNWVLSVLMLVTKAVC